MANQYFGPGSVDFGPVEVPDYGSPSDNLDTPTYYQYDGYVNAKPFYAKDGTTLIGSINADIMRLNHNSETLFFGITTFHGEGGNDVIFLASRNGYGAARLYGDEGSDLLAGNDGNDLLDGGIGDDTLRGYGGKDTLRGGDGYDVLDGGAGADRLIGGTGVDTATYVSANNHTGVRASLANSKINTGDALGDTYDSIENLTGSNYNDQLYGNAGSNVLTGGLGADALIGGAGADMFVYRSVAESTLVSAGRDNIRGFSVTDLDKIDLSLIDADRGGGTDQAFTFIGSRSFTGHRGDLNAIYNATNDTTLVGGDVDGDKKADISILLTGQVNLTANSFVL